MCHTLGTIHLHLYVSWDCDCDFGPVRIEKDFWMRGESVTIHRSIMVTPTLYSPDTTNYPVACENRWVVLLFYILITLSVKYWDQKFPTVPMNLQSAQRFIIVLLVWPLAQMRSGLQMWRLCIFRPLNWLKWCFIQQTSHNILCSRERVSTLRCRWTVLFNVGILPVKEKQQVQCRSPHNNTEALKPVRMRSYHWKKEIRYLLWDCDLIFEVWILQTAACLCCI